MLLTPRWIGRFLLLVVVVAACWWLGSWQWDAAHTEEVRDPPPGTSSLTEVHAVGEPVDREEAGRRVELRGRFDADREVLVVDRLHDGEPGSWVVTAMVVEGASEPGAVVPVVRGWLPEGEVAPPPPEGPRRIEGTLEPTEPDTLRDPERGPLGDGEVETVSSPELLSLWNPPLLQGFVIQAEPVPPAPLSRVAPPATVQVTTDWQNFAYAIQWWLFGAFAIFWFVRMAWVEAEDERGKVGAARGQTAGGPEPDRPVERMSGAGEVHQSSREGSA